LQPQEIKDIVKKVLSDFDVSDTKAAVFSVDENSIGGTSGKGTAMGSVNLSGVRAGDILGEQPVLAEDLLSKKVLNWLGKKIEIPMQRPYKPWKPVRDLPGYLSTTPARLQIGRCGCRYPSSVLFKFLADHAAARDAVHSKVSEEMLQQMQVVPLKSAAEDMAIFLRRPDLGRELSAESVKKVQSSLKKGAQVQIVVGDGLSSTAINTNLPTLLPALMATLAKDNISLGTVCFVENSRVIVGDQIGKLVNAEVVLMLVGERPGLKSAESMGCYALYLKQKSITEANRSMISNIHRKGTDIPAAVEEIKNLTLKILAQRTSGLGLSSSGSAK